MGWARFWVDSVSAVFLKSYLGTAGSASWVPQNQEDLELQLTTMLLEKALYELRYELNLRPDWVRIPLRGILDLVTPAPRSPARGSAPSIRTSSPRGRTATSS